MKKIVSTTLIVAMAVSLLAGCGSSGSTQTTAAPAATEAATTAAAQAETKAPETTAAAEAPAEKISVKIAHAGTEESMMHKAWLVAKDYMEANGNFECTIYPNGTMGSDVELAQAVQNGEIQMSACSTSNLTTFNQNLEVFSLPFAFASEEVAYKVLDGDFGQKMLDSMESAGLKGLGYFESCTYRELSSKKPVHSPDDLKGVKIRVMQSSLHTAIWEGLGAIPSAIPFGELYTALQTGTVDAQDNPLELVIAQGFYEVQNCITLTNHIFQVGMNTCNPDWFNSLSAENQQVVLDAIKAGVEFQRKEAAEQKDGYIQTLKDAGLEVIELTSDELAAFQGKMGAAEQVIIDDIGSELVDELKAAIEAAQ